MLFYIYVLPLWFVCFVSVCAILLWAKIMAIAKRSRRFFKIFKICSALCVFGSLAFVIYATLYGRNNETRGMILLPFKSFIDASVQPEMYRTMLMNLVLFIPFGLSFVGCYSVKASAAKRILFATAGALVVSILIEACQYIFSIGIFQTDDILCNTLGAFLGTLSLPLHRVFIRSYLYDLEFI